LGKSVEDRDPHLQLGNLTLEVPRYYSLTQPLKAAYLDFQ
jgi:hypothetical protein